MKRIFSALLSLVMILALVAAMGITASAKEGDVLRKINFKNDDKYSFNMFATNGKADGVTAEVSEDGSGDIDFVLVGYDTELEYKKLEIACDLLCNGVPFLATNPDVVCPARNKRYLPDCATICYMLEKATGKTPFYIGKPRKEMAMTAIEWKGSSVEKTAIVGDRLYTDIACGKNAGVLSILVLSGESTVDDIEKFSDLVSANLDMFFVLLCSFIFCRYYILFLSKSQAKTICFIDRIKK